LKIKLENTVNVVFGNCSFREYKLSGGRVLNTKIPEKITYIGGISGSYLFFNYF